MGGHAAAAGKAPARFAEFDVLERTALHDHRRIRAEIDQGALPDIDETGAAKLLVVLGAATVLLATAWAATCSSCSDRARDSPR